MIALRQFDTYWDHEPLPNGARATPPAQRRLFRGVGRNDTRGRFGRAAGDVARAPGQRFMGKEAQDYSTRPKFTRSGFE